MRRALLTLGLWLALSFSMSARGAEWFVEIYDYYFTPTNLTVGLGDTVTWVNKVNRAHDTTQFDFNGTNQLVWVSELLDENQTFSFTFTNLGYFPYLCAVHYESNPEQTGTVTVVRINLAPSVSITNPAPNSFFTPPASFTIGADASDSDGSVASVEFFVNGTSAGVSTGPTFSRSVSGLGEGSYSLVAIATDNEGATRTSEAVNIFVQQNAPTNFTLIVAVSPTNTGNVSVTPPPGTNGMYLLGTPVALAAQANAGFRFVNWTGTVTATNNPLVLVMTSDHSVTANFEPIPPLDFAALRGTYAGLLADASETNFLTSGFLSLRITPRGSYRGTATIGGIRSAVAGQFDRFGYAPLVLRRGTLSGSLQIESDRERITGLITDGEKNPTLLLHRSADGAMAGSYALTIDPAAPVLNPGTATLKISQTASAHLSGRLGDGTRISTRTFIAFDGSIPVFALLHGRRGAFLGLWHREHGTVQGDARWFRPADSRSRTYPDGFALEVSVNESR